MSYHSEVHTEASHTREHLPESAVERMAHLSALSLTQEEIHRFSEELGIILGHCRTLDTLDLTHVPLASSYEALSALRPDTPETSLAREEVLSQAPRADRNGFVVPVFLES